MRLERHVGGLGRARQQRSLAARGWQLEEEGWACARHTPPALPLARALHFQLTEDLCLGLAPSGWTVVGFSPRGYAKLRDPVKQDACSLPAALRRQARRERRLVAELSYTLFLAAWVGEGTTGGSGGAP
jgi:hypothetical protein